PVAPPTPTPLSSPNMDDPAQAVTIDGAPATIPGDSARWFKFFYLTDYNKPPFVTIRMLYGVMTGLEFEVYAPERLGSWWDFPPNGHGTTEIVACPSGKCATKDLTWGGAFGATGTYYVRVVNPNAADVTTTLSLQWR
ncbi:MAG: hypothetical protein M1482_04705, partial [Chloroflexi bacterium]|nr:hypothetical protein [Chloroflexota bacterium]